MKAADYIACMGDGKRKKHGKLIKGILMAAVSVPVCMGRIKNIKIGEVLKAEG